MLRILHLKNTFEITVSNAMAILVQGDLSQTNLCHGAQKVSWVTTGLGKWEYKFRNELYLTSDMCHSNKSSCEYDPGQSRGQY